MIAAICLALLVVLALGWVLAPMLLTAAGPVPIRCDQCGADVEDGMAFCARCGWKLDREA